MIGISGWLRFGAAAIALAAASYGAVPVRAADIIADWPTIQMPPPPTLKPATLDPKRAFPFRPYERDLQQRAPPPLRRNPEDLLVK